MPNIDLALVICKEGEDREQVAAALLKCGLCPICCSSVQEARALLSQEVFRVVACSDILPDGNIRGVLSEVNESTVHVPVIVLSHATGWDSYLKALGAGAFGSIVCPPNAAEAERTFWSALAGTIGVQKASHAAT